MNASELANKMLQWEEVKNSLVAIEEEIKGAVLELGKSQTVGCVRATYSGGRRLYDYEAAVADGGVTDEHGLISRHTKTFVDWKSVYEDAGLTNSVFTQSDPSVTVKLI